MAAVEVQHWGTAEPSLLHSVAEPKHRTTTQQRLPELEMHQASATYHKCSGGCHLLASCERWEDHCDTLCRAWVVVSSFKQLAPDMLEWSRMTALNQSSQHAAQEGQQSPDTWSLTPGHAIRLTHASKTDQLLPVRLGWQVL